MLVQFKSSAMGQANAARDKLYDLRECPMSGKDATGADIAGMRTYPWPPQTLSHSRLRTGAIMAKGDFSKVKFKDAMMSKVCCFMLLFHAPALISNSNFSSSVIPIPSLPRPQVFAQGANFDGADFTNAVMDRGNYRKVGVA
jgi:uncharacterized protein YjbI with pentapeptide repeats